jgi:hypothetical protein
VIHRGFTIIAIAGTIGLAGVIAAPAGARGHSTECNASYSNRTFNGGVVVNSGDTCRLENVVIHGGLTVTGGQFKVDNSTIDGGWTITGGTGGPPPRGIRANQCGNNINGGLRVESTSSGGTFVFGEQDHGCVGGRINGGVRFENNINAFALEVDGYKVNGGVRDTGNTGQWNEIEGVTDHGASTCDNNNFVFGGTTALDDEGGTNSYTGKVIGCPA